MGRPAVLIDFGSTFTKASVILPENQELIFSTKSPSTIATDALVGLDACFAEVKKKIGIEKFNNSTLLASSSAAGGLRMIVIGLTPTFSLSAGKNAALGAGSKLLKVYSYKLSKSDMKEIESLAPEIILLCGGTNDGNMLWVMENAKELSGNRFINAPVVFAGNNAIASEVRKIFVSNQKECLIADNIFPDIGELNIRSASEAIRNIFMKQIINMKGLEKVRKMMDADIIPTPYAVLTAGELLAKGTGKIPGLGNTMVIDIGGATTDVYSYAHEALVYDKIIGPPEPYAKRTVEGDLGLRSSADSLVEEIKFNHITDGNVNVSKLEDSINQRVNIPSYLPNSITEKEIDSFLARGAARVSSKRHAGSYTTMHDDHGAIEVKKGKDLTNIKHIVGTGGPIISNSNPNSILEFVLKKENKNILLPENANMYLDSSYIMYATGLWSQLDPDNAITILKNNLKQIEHNERGI